MKKVLLAALGFFALAIVAITAAVIYSFTTVKPTTQSINEELGKHFSKVIYIPNGINPPIQGFGETIYFWEMETPQNEVAGVRLKHNTAFSKSQNIIYLTLQKEEKGDPSIFDKVMPAVIADKKSLDAARDPQKADLSANEQIGSKSLKLQIDTQTNKTVQMVWEFEKSKLPDDIKAKYQKLDNIPEPLLGFLYSLPHFILSLFSS